MHSDIRATTTDAALLGHLVRKHDAICLGFPPEVKEPPAGLAAVHLAIEGGDAFGTYLIRRPAPARSNGAPTTHRPAHRFWALAQTLAAAGTN